jgi:hypothetical protein
LDGNFLSISCPLNPEFRLYGVEWIEAVEPVDRKKDRKIKGFPLTR